MQMADFGDLTFSKLRFYSVGIVAKNKELSSKMIEVCPIEDMGFVDGEITGFFTTVETSGQDANGSKYTSTADTAVSITAYWLALSTSNRITAPDVRRGEYVMIYQFGDSPKYFWTTLVDDMSIRKLETVIYAWSASRVEDTPVTVDSMYYLEVSTHRKLVTFHTCKADNEPFGYDIQLNTKEGTFTLQDDIGNFLYLNSKLHQWRLENPDGSSIDMTKDNLTVTIPSTTKFITKDFLIEASNSVGVKAANSVSFETVNMSSKASGSFSVETSALSMNSSGNASINGAGQASLTSGSNVTLAAPTVAINAVAFSASAGGVSISGAGGTLTVVAPAPITIQSPRTTII